MLHYIHQFPNPYESEFNDEFINSSFDISIEELVNIVMHDFESVENIKILSVRTVLDQDEIDYNRHNININYKKKHLDRIDIPKNKFIAENRYGEMIFQIQITTNLSQQIIEKRILIPVEHDGFYRINSKNWKAIWQLCDASTYTQRGKITLKSRMPIIIYQTKNRKGYDTTGREWSFTSYSYALDTKSKRRGAKKKTKFINPMMIFAAKMGMHRAIEFFGLKDITSLVEEVDQDLLGEYTYFQLDTIFVRVSTEILEMYPYVQSVVCMLKDTSNRDFPVEWTHLNDKEYWICRIGYIGSIKNKNILSFRDKGYTTIHMIERLLDNVTILNLRLPDIYKENIYMLLYWIITNFDQLRTRNNIDMNNKRIRKNEYIVLSSLGKKIAENINKLIEKKSKSKSNTMDTLLEMFNFSSDIILSGMKNLSDVVKSDDLVNDMTFLQDLAYSSKGPNSLGESSSKLISAKFRYIHPSHLGILDLNVSSNSDPGMSGAFVPFVKLYDGYYFNPEHEPCTARYEFEKSLYEYRKNEKKEKLPSAPQYKTFGTYIDYMRQHKDFENELKYEPIRIVEKEPD